MAVRGSQMPNVSWRSWRWFRPRAGGNEVQAETKETLSGLKEGEIGFLPRRTVQTGTSEPLQVPGPELHESSPDPRVGSGHEIYKNGWVGSGRAHMIETVKF